VPASAHWHIGGREVLSVFGYVAFIALLSAALHIAHRASEVPTAQEPPLPREHRVRMLALGDVNLGRHVGQVLLSGDTLHPFRYVRDSLLRYDVVFANLESVLSDQGGETESPRSNMVFTGPPVGARTLRLGGVTLVSVANNHALDYGPEALAETCRLLDAEGIAHAGTVSADRAIRPAVVERNGIRIALFAVTGLMNGPRGTWKRTVAPADTARLLPALRRYRDSVDVVCVSYHGGSEYADRPDRGSLSFMRAVSAAGAQMVFGHHPHVPYGVEVAAGKLIVHSLGNFVFRQPSRFWTQRGLAVRVELVKDSTGVRIDSVSCLPVSAGYQPKFLTAGSADADTTFRRTARLSRGIVID
jgi:poly-gamma-glutamate capsule biosynthesis protein CapA/YwtB (metallophosphatase superfamily)